MSIASQLTTLKEIVAGNYFFNVPLYQRLYVWGDDQVRTLLEDLLTAYQNSKNDMFYLGGCLVVEREKVDAGMRFDLIDGQQRFTTLWMMSLIWKESLLPFQYRDEKQGRQSRIRFSIRPEVDLFFEQLMIGAEVRTVGNPRIDSALAMIESFVKERDEGFNLADFTLFVYENVKMVLTQVPARTDLNKLFELINNRGVQLQHHEILKARMLSALPDPEERDRCATLWDACAEMGNYVEKNLREISKLKVSELYDNEASTSGSEALASADKVLDEILKQQTQALKAEPIMSLQTLLASDMDFSGVGTKDADDETCESDEMRSIISFPMLLQHALRIWLHENNRDDLPRILDKELLMFFERHFFSHETGHEQVTSFIKLLWNIRYSFDKHVIKWVTVGEKEQHLICQLYLNSNQSRGKTYFSLVRQQPTSNDGFALLQSMLYHSQQITTHYWLTPLLAYVQRNPRQTTKEYYAYLRHLDNHLFCSNDARPLIERSHDFLDTPWRRNDLDHSLLNDPRGLTFPHYWFYKLEFILWKTKQAEIKDPRWKHLWKDFRMTAKNSIEHISPQSPQETDRNCVSAEVLDTFGNLALVSRGINSEYGNLPYNEKHQRFINRNTSTLDSLKMALIYQNDEWSDAIAAAHQSEVINLIDSYLREDNEKPLSD